MYKMYNGQWDDESDHDKDSLNSSFWSDGEHEEEEEEEEEIERMIGEEDSKPVEETVLKASEEEKPELNESIMSSESGSDEDDDDEGCSSSCDSPAPSLMTSGYGTYRPEEQDGGDCRDDGSEAAFDQGSRGDLSEESDDEEDDGLCTWEQDRGEARPQSALAGDEARAAARGDDGAQEDVDIKHTNAEEDKFKDVVLANEATNVTSEEGGSVDAEEEEVQQVKEEKSVESDESSSNRDIKFINFEVDFSRMTEDKLWEGNLRPKKDATSCLEERMAELHLSTAAGRDSESEDATSRSDSLSSETDETSSSAFESYIRGVSDTDLRPKTKSFIRPVMSQQTVKKSDPVAKYFQYKQLWEMFKLPGETDRRAIRQEIKERLAYQPPPPKPRRVYVPNTYVVPTEKRRSALRWEVRNDLANGLIPYKYTYPF